MLNKNEKEIKKEIIEIGRRLYEKNISGTTSGNISLRAGNDIFISCHGACLGFLIEEDILKIDLSGKIIKGEGRISTETPMHIALYKNLDTQCVIHSHPLYVNGYFSAQDNFKATTLEAQLILGDVAVIKQDTPTVTNIDAVLEALKIQNIVVLKNHGVVATGVELKDAFSLTELLEDSVKIVTVARIWENVKQMDKPAHLGGGTGCGANVGKKFELFSRQHIQEIVRLINEDPEVARLGNELNLTCTLAIKMDETNQVHKMKMEKGKVVELTEDDQADFIISGKKDIWKAIFERRLDPFAAVMQKKLKLKGDFAKLSKWYSPFYKIFDIWKKVSVK